MTEISLPDDFRNKLEEACARAGGQKKIAQEARISTTHLQQLLDVNKFKNAYGSESFIHPYRPRIRLTGLVRRLVRVSQVLGEKPEDVIQRFGITIEGATSEALRDEACRVDETNSFNPQEHDIHVGILKHPAYELMTRRMHETEAAGELDETAATSNFLVEFAQILIQSISSNWRPIPKESTNHTELLNGLRKDPPSWQIALPFLNVLPRRHPHLQFIPIPGFRLALDAIWISPKDCAQRNAPIWPNVLYDEEYTFLAIRGEAGAEYLKSLCRVYEELQDGFEYSQLANQIIDNARVQIKKGILFLADDALVYQLRMYQQLREFGEKENRCIKPLQWLDEEIEDDLKKNGEFTQRGQFAPSWPLCVVVSNNSLESRELPELISTAINEELFRNRVHRIAQLYAELMFDGWKSITQYENLYENDDYLPTFPPTTWRPENFPQASLLFKVLVRRVLEKKLEDDLEKKLEDKDLKESYRKSVLEYLLPKEWRDEDSRGKNENQLRQQVLNSRITSHPIPCVHPADSPLESPPNC